MPSDNHNAQHDVSSISVIEGFLDFFELALTYQPIFLPALKLFYQHRNELIAEFKNNHLNCYSDARFKHPLWRDQKLFNTVHQSYLRYSTHFLSFLKKIPSLDPQAYFVFEFLINAFSPSNIPFLNPEVLKTKNLKNGFLHFLSDCEKWSGHPLITKCQHDAFELGKTIATTPGKVIFQNELMQLIQYQAVTEKVHPKPILLVTSWVNKFYILDLRPQHSLISWLISEGYTVFVISWINPDKRLRHKSFSDYVDHGVIQSIHIIRTITNDEKINLFGFCLGGTLVSAALATLASKQLDWVETATLIATLIDFANAGPIKQLMGEKQIQLFEKYMRRHGFMHGYKTLAAFQLIAANENIWPFWIKHYLQGKKTLALDTLFWSLDITHTPEQLYRFYIRKLLQENSLAHSPDIQKISVPTFYLAFKEDWLAPDHACFDSCQLLKHVADKTFLLAPGGHLSGVTTKPTQHSQQIVQIKSVTSEETLEQWQQSSEKSHASWHVHWQQWLLTWNSDWIDARAIDSFLEDAPGHYVKNYVWKA